MKTLAICPGTFDPFTNGHFDLVKRGLRIFDGIVVAVATAAGKAPLFSLDKRMELIRTATAGYEQVTVESFDGLLVNYAKRKEAVAVIRGLRAISDYEYELQMATMNRRLDSEIETVFMMPSEDYSFLTSTIVREIASLGGKVTGLVPENVEAALLEQFRK